MALDITINVNLTTSTTATWQGVTFTLSQPCIVGYCADGKPYFVHPGSATTVTWSPATTTVGPDTVNGGMKNPNRDFDHGFDQRALSYLAGVRVAAPVTLAAGDSLVVQTHNPNPTTEGGGTASHPVYSLAYSAILCVASAPPAHSYIPAVGPYSSGGGSRPVYTLDVTTLTFPSYTISSAIESMSGVLGRMGKYHPTASQARPVETRRRMTPAGFTTEDGYGLNVAETMADAGIRLIGNDSTADKRALAKHMMMHFAEWYPAVKAHGTKWAADGGQNQGLILPVILGLGWLGDTAGLAALPTDVASNELTQSFRIDAGLLTKIRDPHSNVGTDWPQTTLRRTISNVSGLVLTFTDGATWLDVFDNCLLVRESDGATAKVVSYDTGAKTMTIDAQPGVPFAVSNVCFNRAPYSQSVNDAEWILKGTGLLNYYAPGKDAAYRNLNGWDGQLLCAHAWGFCHSSWSHWKDYVVRANAGTNPAAPDTYPTHHIDAATEAFWDTHWPAISAVSQTVG